MTLDRVTTALSDRYRIISTLGAGRMATVYHAEDLKLALAVAIRVMHPELDARVSSSCSACRNNQGNGSERN